MESLKPYRKRIDELDDKIVDLLAERIDVVREVGVLKFREGIPVVINSRVDEVRERVANRAASNGFDPDLGRKIYTLLIDYCCSLEEEIKEEHKRQAGILRDAAGQTAC